MIQRTGHGTNELKGRIDAISGRTLAAKLRTVMPEIDRRIREGVEHEEIVEALREAGIDVNLNTFRSYLYRYRKKLRTAEGQPARSQSTTEASGNSPVESARADEEAPSDETAELDDLLDASKRGALGEKYLGQKRPIFGTKRSKK